LVDSLQRQLTAAQKKGDSVQEGARYRAKIMEIAKQRVVLVAELVVRPFPRVFL
jgi:hypothetical protein